ncbi:MAG: hypothetical protein R2706_20275 [Acidimicrobiales bacterium]
MSRWLSVLVVVLGIASLAAPVGADTTRADQDRWYSDYPGHAGSYEVSDNVGEGSGVVASRQYPGFYWMIQDSYAGVDRRKLIAIRLDHRSTVPTAGTLLDIGK